MDQLLVGVEEFTAAYLDDLIIFSESWEDHLSHVEGVLERVRAAGLTVRPKKCQFGMTQCVYLGHIVGNGLVEPEASKVETVISATSNQEASSWLPRVVRTLSEVYFRIHYFGRTSHSPHLEIYSNTGSVDTTVWASLQRAEEAAVQYSCVVVKGYSAWFCATDGCF